MARVGTDLPRIQTLHIAGMVMDIGFSRRARQHKITPLDQLNYVSLLAELAATQAESATARAQSKISSSRNGASATTPLMPEKGSFHPLTAALLRNEKE